jgi:hypothetical protein
VSKTKKNTDNCILKACYEDMSTFSNAWLNNIKDELSDLGPVLLKDLRLRSNFKLTIKFCEINYIV